MKAEKFGIILAFVYFSAIIFCCFLDGDGQNKLMHLTGAVTMISCIALSVSIACFANSLRVITRLIGSFGFLCVGIGYALYLFLHIHPSGCLDISSLSHSLDSVLFDIGTCSCALFSFVAYVVSKDNMTRKK